MVTASKSRSATGVPAQGPQTICKGTCDQKETLNYATMTKQEDFCFTHQVGGKIFQMSSD